MESTRFTYELVIVNDEPYYRIYLSKNDKLHIKKMPNTSTKYLYIYQKDLKVSCYWS